MSELTCYVILGVSRTESLEIPLRGLGIQNFYLRLHVFVDPDVSYERR